MTVKSLPILLTALLACAVTCVAQPASPSPKATADEFYRTYLKLQIRGLPSEADLKTFTNVVPWSEDAV